MSRPTITDALTALSAGSAIGAAVAFALAEPGEAGILLAVAIALVALTVRSVARDVGRQQAQIVRSLRRVERKVDENLAKNDLVVRSNRRVMRTAIEQAERIEERSDAMTRRILSDIGAARASRMDRDSGDRDRGTSSPQ